MKMVSKLYDKAETMPSERLRKLQLALLNSNIRRARSSSKFYKSKKRFEEIKNLDEISKLPLTLKEDLRNANIWDVITKPKRDIVEYHTSSGTTGAPFIMALSKKDISISNQVLARTWYMHGIREKDSVQMMVSYGLFTAGLLNQYALQHIGANIIPTSILSTEKQIEIMKLLEPDFLVAVSSYYLRLIAVLEENNINGINLKGIVGGGVPVQKKMRKFVEDKLETEFFIQYGLAEINTGLAGECKHHDGLHIQADYAYPEIVDIKTKEPLQDGEKGILVLSTLQRDGQIVLRYLTNDITSITHEKCACGRTMPRIATVTGRIDDIIFIKGSKFDPEQMQKILDGLSDMVYPLVWQMKLGRQNGGDKVELLIEPKEGRFDAIYFNSAIAKKLEFKIDKITLVNKIMTGEEHKFHRIVDNR